MDSALTKACTIKIQNFEGPFDLLYHLIEKNQFNIYDIPINTITDQYMEYLFAVQELDLEVASEFLVTAATLLHIKSKMLLPEKNKKPEEELDPREELIKRLIEYKKYKEFSTLLREREIQWAKHCYKLPECIEFEYDAQVEEISIHEIQKTYYNILEKNKNKVNVKAANITVILQQEKVSMKTKMKEIIHTLLDRTFFHFSELFTLKRNSRTEVVTGFLAILELSKRKRINLEQKEQFSEILVYRNEDKESFFDGD